MDLSAVSIWPSPGVEELKTQAKKVPPTTDRQVGTISANGDAKSQDHCQA